MHLPNRLSRHVLSWKNDTPLPAYEPGTSIAFQSWHHFESGHGWVPLVPLASGGSINQTYDEASRDQVLSPLTLLTWNIDAASARVEERVNGIIDCIVQLQPAVDIIFFQEVSRPALRQILESREVQESWFSSEHDDTSFGAQSFATLTLLSKTRFASGPADAKSPTGMAVLGSVWRVKYPSRYSRDALCCDILVPSTKPPSSLVRIRLINVHLDSLPIKPSRRPQQLSIASSFLRSARRGIVAGDFNPVMEEDDTLVQDNHLDDAWTTLNPDQPGHTWGTDGKQPFPACRLDKVALTGLRAHAIRIVPAEQLGDGPEESQSLSLSESNLSWSDHHALVCSFGIE
ncbi:Endonuclease/exonuclease/phosphatase [Stachybotrys elegans]|uniref:Endonuclease/exonuclease/phosphatase n=1 Tax=Stachybotrys elegans TaxID=80388 RepID=A0A8K0SYL5_9HYPO|nr:Endonuclease/exonuclease/phosphatase [Stachybotrys elegans]